MKLCVFVMVAAWAVAGCHHKDAQTGVDPDAGGTGDGGSGGGGSGGGGAGGGSGGGSGGSADASMDAAADAGPTEMDAGPGCVPAGTTPPSPGLTLIADSIAGFSDTQGHCRWSYGYVEPATDRLFHPMTDWDPGYPAWWAMRGIYWTLVAPDRQHTNGTTTTGGRTPVEQWSVRRWSSTVSGNITITGSVHKVAGSEGGNGVEARIVVNDMQRFTRLVDAADTVGTSFTVTVQVFEGTPVDFVLDPHEANDALDTTFFAAQIWR